MRARLLVAWSVAALTAALTTAALAGPAAGTTRHRPTITSMSLRTAPTTGGQRVVVHGRNMSQHLRVTVLGRVVGYRRLSDHTITVRVPSRSAPAHGWLRVHTATGGTSATGRASSFAYHWPAPVLTSVSPEVVSTNGPMVTVHGRYLHDVRSVTEGGIHPYSFSESDDGRSLTFDSPDGAPGRTALRVTTAQGSATTTVTIAPPPWVNQVFPTDGPVAGGTVLTIRGSALGHPTRVTVGGVPATHVVGVSSGTVTAVAPAHTAGPADVVVTNAIDSSARTSRDRFRYGPVRAQSYSSPATIDAGNALRQLSCPEPGFCMAIDSNDRYLTGDGQSWSAVSPDDATGAAGSQTLACTSASFCLSAIQDLVWRWDGHTWTRIGPPLDDRTVDIQALDCASPTMCVAISRTRAWVYDGTSFGPATQPPGTAFLGLAGVSCWAGGSCEVVTTNRVTDILVNGTWQADGHLAADSSGDAVTSLYCADHAGCLAGTNAGSVVSRSAVTAQVLPVPVTHLVCSSASSCLAAGTNIVATSADAVWSASQVSPAPITAITRTGAGRALVGSGHDVRTLTW